MEATRWRRCSCTFQTQSLILGHVFANKFSKSRLHKKKKRRISCSVKLHFHWHKSLANEHAVQLADPLLLNKMMRMLNLSLRNKSGDVTIATSLFYSVSGTRGLTAPSYGKNWYCTNVQLRSSSAWVAHSSNSRYFHQMSLVEPSQANFLQNL